MSGGLRHAFGALGLSAAAAFMAYAAAWTAESLGGRGAAAEALFFLALLAATLALAGAPRRRTLALNPLRLDRTAALYGVAVLILLGIEALVVLTGLFIRPSELIAQARADAGAVGVANAVLLAPVAEELLFRGLLFTRLRQTLGALATVAITAFAFAAFHLEHGIGVISMIPAGLFFGFAREHSGGVALPVLLHAAMNGAAGVAGLVLVTWRRLLA